MIDIAAEVITAIASGAGGSLGAKGAEAINHLISALRERLRGHPASMGALEVILEDPASATAGEHFLALLRDHLRDDPEFREWLASSWGEIRPALQADTGSSANIVSGTVHGTVVQARDVQGGIHLGPPPL